MAVPGPELLADPAGSPGLLRCQAPSLSRPGPAEATVPAESSLADTCSSPPAARSPRGWPPAAPSGRSLTQVALPTISPAAGWGGSERHTPDSWPDTPEDQLLTGEGGFSGLGPPLGARGPHVAGRAAAARRPRLDSAPSQEEAASPDTALIHMALADRLLDRIALSDTGTTLCSCSVRGEEARREPVRPAGSHSVHRRGGAPQNTDSDLAPQRRSNGCSTGPCVRFFQQPLYFKSVSDLQRSRKELRARPRLLTLRPSLTSRWGAGRAP